MTYLHPAFKSAATIAILMFETSSASADWQYTKWGMSPSEVIASSNNRASSNDDRGKDRASGNVVAKLKAPYSSGTYGFTAFFRFDQLDTLVDVSLDLTSGDCDTLVATLANSYGPPKDKTNAEVYLIYKWWDQSNNNSITYTNIGGECSVGYSQSVAPNKAGGL